MANYDDILAQIEATPEEDSGPVGHVLKILSYIDRPRNALATGVQSGLSDDPNESFLSGLKKGFLGDQETSWGDVAGIAPTSEKDTWGDYLTKGGSRLALDVVFDPSNLLFAPAKAAGLVGRGVKALGVPVGRSIAGMGARALGWEKAAEAIAGSSLGKAFMHRLPSTAANDEIEAALAEGFRRSGQARGEAEPLVSAAQKAYEGGDVSAIRELFERKGALDPTVQATLGALHGKDAELLEPLNAIMEKMGMEPIRKLSEADVRRVPRIVTDEGKRLIEASDSNAAVRTGVRRIMQPEEFGSRELKLLEGLTTDTGAPIVKKAEFLDRGPNGEFLYKGQPVKLTEATLQDIYKSGAMKLGSFVDDPALSFFADIVKKSNQTEYLKTLDTLVSQGAVVKLEKGEAAAKGFREVNVPGLEGYVAKKSVANRLENLASSQFDPNTPIGAVGELLKAMNNTVLGRGLSKFTQAWKKTILPLHPGYHTANITTNIPQMYLGDVNPAMILPRTAQGLMAYLRKHEPFPGMNFMDEMSARGIEHSGFFGGQAPDALEKAIQGEGRPILDKLGKAGYPLRKVADAHDWLIEKVGQPFGQAAESASKLGVIIDYLKKHPEFAKASPEEKARILDEAANFGHNAMIDYRPSAFTPTETQLRNIIPFLRWQRGITGRTLESLVTQPQKLANIERFLEASTIPMDAETKDIMDPWQKEQAPIAGILGHRFAPNPETGDPTMMLLGRYLPHGNIEQMVSRPKDFLQSIINPALKAPYELATNESSFKSRNIDELSGGFPGNVLNPLIPGNPNYQQASETLFGQPIPAAYDYILSQLPGGRYLQEAHQAGLATGAWQDPYKQSMTGSDFAQWYATGGKKYPLDTFAALSRRNKERAKAIAAFKADLNYALIKGDDRRYERTLEKLDKFLEQNPEPGSSVMNQKRQPSKNLLSLFATDETDPERERDLERAYSFAEGA